MGTVWVTSIITSADTRHCGPANGRFPAEGCALLPGCQCPRTGTREHVAPTGTAASQDTPPCSPSSSSHSISLTRLRTPSNAAGEEGYATPLPSLLLQATLRQADQPARCPSPALHGSWHPGSCPAPHCQPARHGCPAGVMGQCRPASPLDGTALVWHGRTEPVALTKRHRAGFRAPWALPLVCCCECSCCSGSRISLPGCPARTRRRSLPAQAAGAMLAAAVLAVTNTDKASPRVLGRKSCVGAPPRQRSGGGPLCHGDRGSSRQHSSCAAGSPATATRCHPCWDPAGPLLTQSLGHVNPLGTRACW